MWINPQETADLVIFTEEILNGKLHFLCNDREIYREGKHQAPPKNILDSMNTTIFSYEKSIKNDVLAAHWQEKLLE